MSETSPPEVAASRDTHSSPTLAGPVPPQQASDGSTSPSAVASAKPAGIPKPGPRPSPALLAAAAHPLSAAMSFGRVDGSSGTVYVRTPEGEKEVGAYPGASPSQALAYFARKYDELLAAADLLLQRLGHTDLSAREAADGLAKLREQTADPKAVGDLAALEAKVEQAAAAVAAKRQAESAQRAAAREGARQAREALVAEAERLAGQPEASIQWKTSGARMRELLEEWKTQQRGGPKLDRDSESALWRRLSAARSSFDKARRVHFAQLEGSQAEARAAKEQLVSEAEALATSTDWGPTATAFRKLMDRWRAAGRAARADDDALWDRFKAAQDAFFTAKDALAAAENDELAANLKAKESLLAEAQRLLPVTDLEAAKAGLRAMQQRWDAVGKVPRADLERIEKALRRIESGVRDAEETRRSRSNPEAAARAESLATQLEAAVEGLRRDVEQARSSGDPRRLADAEAALAARELWLAQARRGMQEFGS